MTENLNITFRLIEKSDNKEIAEVIRTVFREFKIDKPGTVYYDPTTDDLFRLFRKPGGLYWIAEENGVIIGGCGIYATSQLPEGCAELVKLYILPWVRNKGIGRMLFEKSIESARQLGYTKLYLESMPELTKAISLYERSGFRFLQAPMGNSGHFNCTVWMVKDL